MSDVPFEETSPNPENTEPPEFNAPAEDQDPGRPDEYWACVQGVAPCSYHRAEMLDEMTRDAEPHADQVDTFGPPRTGRLSPAEAHEQLLRVTGQARADQDIREQLAGKRPMMPARPADYGGEHVATPVTSKINLGDMAFGPEFARYMADNLLAEAKADEASLRAMGAKGDGHDVLFEIDQPDLGLFDRRSNPRLRVLLRNGPAPVAVDAAVSRDMVERWADMVQVVGQAMAECANKISAAVAAMQSGFGPEVPAAYQQTCPDAKPCMYQCPISVGCSRGVQGPPDPDTLLREDGEPF